MCLLVSGRVADIGTFFSMTPPAIDERQGAIGDCIRRARESRGTSLRALAAQIKAEDRVDGLDSPTLRLIETGERRVASHELVELAEVLDVTVASLLGRTQSPAASLVARLREL